MDENGNVNSHNATWSGMEVHIFCDVCIEAIQKGRRSSTSFGWNGWLFVWEVFKRRSGSNYDKQQLKNKWGWMRKEWKAWKSLLGNDANLVWDPLKNAVEASDDWRDSKIQENPRYKKFREEGIDLGLYAKYDLIFGGTFGTQDFHVTRIEGSVPLQDAATLMLEMVEKGKGRGYNASWSPSQLHIFCDVCTEAIQKGMRAGTGFGRNGWPFVWEEFRRRSGSNYGQHQLKNKWDYMRKEWNEWKSLLENDPALVWDPLRMTLHVSHISEDWWDSKIRENHHYKKFRKEGIALGFFAKYDAIFRGISGIGDLTSPSAAAPLPHTHLPEGDGDSEANLTITEETEPGPAAGKRSSESNLEGCEYPKPPKRRTDATGCSEKYHRPFEKLADSVENQSAATDRRNSPPGCTISEVMADLQSLPDIEDNEHLLMLATDLIQDEPKRQIYASFQNASLKYTWLNYHYTKSKQI